MKKKQLKVVHLSFEDSYGAARAAIRISSAVRKLGVDSKVCVLNKNETADSFQINLSRIEKLKRRGLAKLNQLLLRKYPERGYFHVDRYGINLAKYPDILFADIVHLHWINDGIWSDSFVNTLIKLQKPIVWTMHDMWPFTGGCHYDDFCDKYKQQCGNCKVLGSDITKDEAYKTQKRKKNYFEKLNIYLVGCSNWITEQAKKSFICSSKRERIICIPNPIDDQVFRLYNKVHCKEFLNVQKNKKLILFGAVNATSDKRKGGKYLINAIKKLNPQEYVIGIFGCKTIDIEIDTFEIVNFGRISDDFHLSVIYNAADVFVAPSVQENLANTVMEALACGTPVVAFDIGGMADMITHLHNGYLVSPFDVDDFVNGIHYAVSIKDNREKIRQEVLERFSEEVIGNAYLELYHKF